MNHLVKVIVLANLASGKSLDSRIIDYLLYIQRGVEINNYMNSFPGLFRRRANIMYSIGSVVF